MTNSELSHELMLQLFKTRMSFRQTLQRALKQNNVDMTFEMLQIMHRLWREQGVSQQFLAEKTAKDKACLTNLINNLEKKGWVVRKEDPTDRRNRLVYLTEEGENLSKLVTPLIQHIYQQTGEEIGMKQLEVCINLLRKYDEILEKI